jgi:DNA modification methylase
VIYRGDLFDVLPTLEAESVDACVTDPPYELAFMGKAWDGTGVAFTVATWAEVFRVLKPGAHLVAFGGTRTFHRMTCAIEDAGFEIRDCLSYLYGSGFPKSLNIGCTCRGNALSYSHAKTPERDLRPLLGSDVSTALDADGEQGEILLAGLSEPSAPAHRKADGARVNAGREQSVVEGRQLHRAGQGLSDGSHAESSEGKSQRLRAGASSNRGAHPGPAAEAERGSASHRSGQGEQRPEQSEGVRLAPGALDDGASSRRAVCQTCGGLIAAKGQGTALKPAWEPIILARKPTRGTVAANVAQFGTAALNIDACRVEGIKPDVRAIPKSTDPNIFKTSSGTHNGEMTDEGRWPANVLLDEAAAAALDEQTGELVSGGTPAVRYADKFRNTYGGFKGGQSENGIGGSCGGASRFYYVAKPSREERDMGCHDLKPRQRDESRKDGNPGGDNPRNRGLQPRGNHHPTVKPVELMRWLVRLVTPPDGVVLDPFMGSGTTGMACRYEQRRFIGIEREAEYVEIAERRIAAVAPLFGEQSA